MKRQRFTVKKNDGIPFVVLAYTAEGVQRAYPGATVTRGDYRKQARAASTPSTAQDFRLDHAAIREAIDLLGIEWPVEFKTHSRQGDTLANHGLRYSGGAVQHRGNHIHNISTATRVHHRIMVKTYNTVKWAGECIWHELCHAMQAEREAKAAGATTMEEIHAAWRTCSARGVGINYKHKPIEVEAREFETWNDDHPLAKARHA